MYPPSNVCRRLWRIHPQIRLAWMGRPPSAPNDMNAGSFAVIQLYHVSDVGDLFDPDTYRQPWDVDYELDETNTLRGKRIDRGPIFDKEGRPRRDWDPLVRVPIVVATVDKQYQDPFTGEPLSNDDVLNGKIVSVVQRWMEPIKKRVKDSVAAQNKAIADAADENSEEMVDYLAYEANKSDSRSDCSMARKFYKEDWKAMERRHEMLDNQIRNTYRVPK